MPAVDYESFRMIWKCSSAIDYRYAKINIAPINAVKDYENDVIAKKAPPNLMKTNPHAASRPIKHQSRPEGFVCPPAQRVAATASVGSRAMNKNTEKRLKYQRFSGKAPPKMVQCF